MRKGRGAIPTPVRPPGVPPFQVFLEEHRGPVFRFLLASVGPQEVDDCFQDTFLAALRAYPQLRHGDNLRGWVLSIAARKAIDAGRARARRAAPVGDPARLDGVHRDPDPPAPSDPLWDAVRALPPKQRVAVVQRVVLDRPYEEVAAALGCTPEAARASVYQGLKRLRAEWPGREEDR
jgi:RNA polymerase sigma factor (sigma-70 family)